MATDTPMQLGMVGLGRMGANIVRRLLRDGHECVGYNRTPDAVTAVVAEGAVGASSLEDFASKLVTAARGLGDGARGRRSPRRRDHCAGRGARARRRRSSTAAIPITTTTSAARPSSLREGHPPCRRGHERRRVGPRARLLLDDRRRAGGRRAARPAVRSRSRRVWTPLRARRVESVSPARPSTATTTAAPTAPGTS